MLAASECNSETQTGAKLVCAVRVTEGAWQDGMRLWSPCWSIKREGPVTRGGSQESEGFTTNTAYSQKSSSSQDNG